MRPPEGPARAYRKHLRSLSDKVAARVQREIGPLLELSLPNDVRQDATEDDVRNTIRARLANIKRSLARAGELQAKTIDTVAARTLEANGREFERVIRINPRQVQANLSPLIDRFRKENVDLIQSIPDTLLDNVSKIVDEVWSNGERVETLRAKIQDRFNVSKSKADLIARDQVLKLNGQITRERQKASGITEYIWTTARDERVRDMHAELDGTRQRWDADPVTNEQGDTNPPGGDYQCRCVAAPILSFLEDEE